MKMKNRSKAAIALGLVLAALAMSGCTGAVDVCDNSAADFLATGEGSFVSIWDTWQSVVVTAVLIIFLISAFVYMLAGVASHRGLRVWAQSQMYEGFATLVIAMFIVGLVSWMCGFDASYVGAACPASGDCSVFTVAENYLLKFNGQISDGWWYIVGINMVLAALANFTYHMGAPGLGVTMTFGQGLSQVSSSMSSALIAVTVAQVLTLAQIQVLRIAQIMFGYLLPVGVILRAFGFTRGFGGALIAIAVGFYIIYPAALVLVYGLLLNEVSGQIEGMGPTGDDVDSWQSEGGGTFGKVCGFVGTLCVGAAVVPFLVFIIVVAFTKSLSSQLGEEVDVSNLTKMI